MSGITVGTALAVSAGVGAAGSIASGVIGANAAGNAAKTQSQAAMQAAQLQHQDAQDALAFQKKQFDTNQANLAPWLKTGQQAIGQLGSEVLSGQFKPWDQTFQAPTMADAQNDPGYQFRLDQGKKAIEASSAARGGVLSGGTAKALDQYSQDLGSQEYQNIYSRRLGEYQQAYDIFRNNQADEYNRLAGISGSGQQAAGTVGQLGQQAAGNVTNIDLTSGQQIGNAYQNAGAARASGYVGGANAITGAIGGVSSNLQSMMLLKYLQGQQPQTGAMI